MKIQYRVLLLTLDTVLQYILKNKQLHSSLKLNIFIPVTVTITQMSIFWWVFKKVVDQPHCIQHPKQYCTAPRIRKPTALNGGKQFQ